MVVVAPLSQVMVPPVASALAVRGVEPPPVFPPVHPLTVMSPATFPESVVQTIVTFGGLGVPADAGPVRPITAAPDTGMANAAASINVRRILFPFGCRLFSYEGSPPKEYPLRGIP